VLVAALVMVAGCSSADDRGEDPAGAGSSTAVEPAPAPDPPFAVGRRTMRLVDESRPTAANPAAGLEAASSRTIEVEVLYPAAGEAPGLDETVGSSTPDAPPAGRGFPLVVWAHGVNGVADLFVPYGESWAREGFVVAIPTFPLSREGVGDAADVQNQPGDMSFVIDEVLGLDDDDPLAGIADGDHVAVGGHSLGAATVFGVAFNTCCLDDRVDAAISVSGGGLVFEGGDYVEDDTVPLLLVQGARDETVPVGVGDATFRNQPAPITYLRFTEADHNNMFWGDDQPVLERAVLAFLDAELRGDPSGIEALPQAVRDSGRAELRTK
jgi:dienelactone hydrolase